MNKYKEPLCDACKKEALVIIDPVFDANEATGLTNDGIHYTIVCNHHERGSEDALRMEIRRNT